MKHFGIALIVIISISQLKLSAQWSKHIIDENMTPRCVSVNIADMNGDNEWDIMVTNGGERKIILYQNDFPQWKENIIADNVVAPFASPGDIDGDDTLDVVACLYLERKMVWYENNLPEEWTQHIIAENTNWNDYVVVIDINNDNKLDVVSAVTTSNYHKTGDVVWYENNHPTWTPHIIESDVSGCGYIDVTDVDGDGFNDIIATLDKEGKVVWYKSVNIGTPRAEWIEHTIDDSLKYAWIVNSDDINEDGKMDIVATAGGPYHNGSDLVWYENPTWIKHVIDADLAGANFAEIADVDGDGRLDVIAGGFDADDVVWYKNNHPTWNKTLIDADLDGPRGITLEDLDGDGIKDVTVAALTNVVWYKNPFSPQTIEDSFEFEGLERDYIVYLPSNFQPEMPLVINLHGSWPYTAEWMMNYTQINEIADTAGFVAVYPNSISPRWSANSGITTVTEPNVNDVGFISNLIDTLIQRYEVDTNRIYCYGLNYGGWMASELFCQVGHRFAAGARVNTSLGISQADRSKLNHPFPIVLFNGTADTYLPWPNGGNGKMGGEEAINWWVEHNECEQNGDTISLPDLDPTDNCTVEKISYKNSSDETNVVFYKVINGGLSWPGAVGNETWDKPRNMDINAGVEIWNFFKDYAKPEEETPTEPWTKRANIPTPRSYSSACEVDGKIYVIGGCATDKTCMNVMEVYDPTNNTWETKTPMNTSRLSFGVGVVNGKIYVFGGTTGHTVTGGNLDVVEVYDPLTDTWETKSPMPVARRASACGVIGNKIYVAGGSPTSWWGSNTNKLDIYDSATDTWDITKADMPKSLFGPTGAVLADKFYLIGGLHSGTWTGQKWVQIYDPATNSWELGPNLMYERFAHSVEVVDGKLYVIGGTNKSGGGPLDTIEEVEVYDPNENSSWTKIDDTPVLFKMHASSVYEDIIYSFSGSQMGGTNMTPVSDVYSFEPDKAPTSVREEKILPDLLTLYQNYPNPFNPSTTIKYSIPSRSVILSEAKNLKDFSSQAPQNDNANVTLKIYDILGREVATLVNQKQRSGNYEIEWNAVNQSSGIYFYQLTAGQFVETKKLVVLK